jgi:hypothetical protein
MVRCSFTIELSWGAELPLHRVQQEREARARLKREKEEVRQYATHHRRTQANRVFQREARERKEVR